MHPILLRIPWVDLPIYSYGFMLGISFIVGWYLTMHFAEEDGVPRQVASGAMTLAILGALVGARVLYFVTNPGSLQSLGDFFAFNRGGLVAYGGFLGGTGLGFLYLRARRVGFLRFADHAAPAMALGTAITRVGCLLYGCDYGAVSNLPWALSFPKGSPAFNHHLRDGLIPEGATHSLPVHPTQIYESLYGLMIFGSILLARRWWRGRRQGYVFLLFVSLYAFFRFLNEFLRADLQRGTVGPLSTSQFIGVLTLAAAALGYLHLRKHGQEVGAPATVPAARPGEPLPDTGRAQARGSRKGRRRR